MMFQVNNNYKSVAHQDAVMVLNTIDKVMSTLGVLELYRKISILHQQSTPRVDMYFAVV